MAKYAWVTDIHLDFLSQQPNKIISFIDSIKVRNPDGLIITGDLSISNLLPEHLGALEAGLQMPINFVLGNHDYYGSSIESVRRDMHELSNVSQYLKYIPTTPYISLSPQTALVGHDGWYDGLNGSWQASNFVMSDWFQIREFLNVVGNEQAFNYNPVNGRRNVVDCAQEIAMECVQRVHDQIRAAVRTHKNVVVATHVPPFTEAHMHNGRFGSESSHPWYTSKIMGDMLKNAARVFPDTMFVVLAGHTHGKWDGQVGDYKNLHCHVGGSEYGHPLVQDILEV